MNKTAREIIRLIEAHNEGLVFDKIILSTKLNEDLLFNPIDNLEFVMNLEEAFDVIVDDEMFEACVTVEDVVKLVEDAKS